MPKVREVSSDGQGTLLESNGFLIPVLSGSNHEMGRQYGALMVDHMQNTYDLTIAPMLKSGVVNDDVAHAWTQRGYETMSLRNRDYYDGLVEGSGWPLDKVGMLDAVMEFGIYQSKIHAFAGCTSIAAWGDWSTDGGAYVGRNMDWSPAFNKFAQVVTIRKPSDGSYRTASVGWPGMHFAMTVINERGVYLDLHDGTSMGGSIVYEQRPSVLSTLSDFMAECGSANALARRVNGVANSVSAILSLADESGAVSMECSSIGGNRVRLPEDDSLVVVNTFLDPGWGMGRRETVSNSLRRFDNMTARLAERRGSVDAAVTRDLMDLTLFNADGGFAENGGCTKPTKVDADSTVYQTVCDTKRRQLWIKVPAPDYFADWTHLDLPTLWA